jgi:uncharacterized membrane protein
MNSYKWPALGIVSVTLILILINNLTEMTFVTDYALLFIIAGMFVGVFLGRLSNTEK